MTTTEAVATLRRMNDPNSHWLSAREREALGLAVELLEPKPEMTLEEAVKVMNEQEYLGQSDWHIYTDGDFSSISCRRFFSALHSDTAIAVAEKLLRLKGGA